MACGGGGIRTHENPDRSADLKSAAINRSATPPKGAHHGPLLHHSTAEERAFLLLPRTSVSRDAEATALLVITNLQSRSRLAYLRASIKLDPAGIPVCSREIRILPIAHLDCVVYLRSRNNGGTHGKETSVSELSPDEH